MTGTPFGGLRLIFFVAEAFFGAFGCDRLSWGKENGFTMAGALIDGEVVGAIFFC